MIQKRMICYLLMTLLIVPMALSRDRAIRPAAKQFNGGIRQALVIGNSKYRYAGFLRNPVNDARAIGYTLKQLGFQVTTVTDADQRKMERSIKDFGKQLRDRKGVGLFYYAGHGMQFDGENYLLPTDIDPSTEEDVRYDAVPLGKLLAQMRLANNKMNIVVLDACRNNPFSRSFRTFNPGLAQVNAVAGTFISFATAPGQIAADGSEKNGLFTSKLLQHLATPGLKIEEVFKRTTADVYRASNQRQAPWVQYSVIGDFYLAPETVPTFTTRTELGDLKKKSEVLRRERQKKQELKSLWEEWQQKMQEDYDQVAAFDLQSTDDQLTTESWQRFLRNWTDDNPYSYRDAELRSRAEERLSYLQNERDDPQRHEFLLNDDGNIFDPRNPPPTLTETANISIEVPDTLLLRKLKEQRKKRISVERQYNSLLYEQLRGQINAGPQFSRLLNVGIEFQIELDGSVSAYRIKESSGSKQFDLVVMTGMKAIKFPRLPQELVNNPPYIVTLRIQP